MNIEKEIKRKYPDKSDAEIRAIRIEAFKKLFNSQANYWNWKNKRNTPYFDTLLKVCKELNLYVQDLDYENKT